MRRRRRYAVPVPVPKRTGLSFECTGLSELVTRAKQVPSQWSGTSAGHALSMTFEQTVHRAILGDTSLVPRAESLIEQLSLDIELPARMHVSSPYGGYAIVPEAIAGIPEPMRTLRAVPNESAPIGVWFNVGSSCSLTAAQLLERGIPVLALVLALQSRRPVELHLIYACNGCSVKCTVDTHPLDLATTCFAICDANFTRHLVAGIIRELSGAFLGYGVHEESQLRSHFNIPAEDIILSGGSALASDYSQLISNPLAWIKAKLAQYLGEEE